MQKSTVYIQKPVIGKIVNFFHNNGNRANKDLFAEAHAKNIPVVCVPAMIMMADDMSVDIKIFNNTDEAPRMRHNIKHKSESERDQPYWEWPDNKDKIILPSDPHVQVSLDGVKVEEDYSNTHHVTFEGGKDE